MLNLNPEIKLKFKLYTLAENPQANKNVKNNFVIY